MAEVIPIPNPAYLPVAVRTYREGRGLGRLEVIRSFIAACPHLQSDPISMSSQWSSWELGEKSPNLSSLKPYLEAHGLTLAVVRTETEP